jgi:hypothetical protein
MGQILHGCATTMTRELEGREASPIAGAIDSQSVKSADKGGAQSTRQAMMRVRRSKARSAISWPIPLA